MGKIILSSSPKGEVKIRTEGFKGPECMSKSKWLEEALGTPSSVEETAEYFETEASADTTIEVES
jgi:hypothetical protein